jgi:hypothetical protein
MIVNLFSDMKKRMKSKYSNMQLAALADAFKRTPLTIRRWEIKKDDRLESDKARLTLKLVKI